MDFDLNKRQPGPASDIKQQASIRRIHRHLLAIVLGALIVGALVFAGLYRANILGPIRGGNFGNLVLRWQVSDHQVSGSPLSNQLNGTDDPRYDDEAVTELQRKADGSLLALPRYQGTLEYHN